MQDMKQDLKLVLYFDRNNPETYRNISDCLARVSPATKGKMDPFLASGRFVLKRNADPETDLPLAVMFEAAGGYCRFETTGPKISEPSARTTTTAQAESPIPPSLMVCPKCQCSQPVAAECHYCGVVIRKVYQQQIRSALATTYTPSTPLPVHLSLWEKLRNRSDEVMALFKNLMPGGDSDGIKIHRWSQRVWDAFSRLIIVLILSLVFEIAMLHMMDGMWYVYTATPAGQHFVAIEGGAGESLQYAFELNLIELGLRATICALVLCLVAGAAGQLVHLLRFFYTPFGFFGHLLLWGLPLTAVNAWCMCTDHPHIMFSVAFVFSLIPVVLLMNRSFCLIQALVPEMGALISTVYFLPGGLGRWLKTVQAKLGGLRRKLKF